MERLLLSLGADPELVDAVLGDLAEERASRTELEGTRAARWWYLREALRSAPHLAASAVRRASWRQRAALTISLAAIALAATFAVTRLFGDSPTPARLVASGSVGDEIVVNNLQPVRLAMQVLDSSGRVLPDTGVRFRWSSGVPVPVSPTGVATCTRSGDAVVRASLGALATQLRLRCRPVSKVLAPGMLNIVRGDEIEVPFAAVDSNGQAVTQLRGVFGVKDSSVATIDVGADGMHRLRARAAGSTALDVHIGDKVAHMEVHVYEPARSPDGIRAGQHLAIPTTVAGGEMRQWRLAAAPQPYYVTMLPGGDERLAPRMTIVGAYCKPALVPHSFFCLAQHDATLFIFHSRAGDQTRAASGTLAVWRLPEP